MERAHRQVLCRRGTQRLVLGLGVERRAALAARVDRAAVVVLARLLDARVLIGDGGGANARRDYPRGGASIRALDRRGPERRANRALDELGSREQR